MAKKAKDIKPIFPLKHEFYDSLDRVLAAASRLETVAKFATEEEMGLHPKMREQLIEVLREFHEAYHAGYD